MTVEAEFPNFQMLVDAYLNWNYDLLGETIADVLRVYLADLDEEMRLGAVAEIEEWSFAHRQQLRAPLNRSSNEGFQFCCTAIRLNRFLMNPNAC
ncbi:hypothetical protein OKW49_004343 [Paraburkholderia youngii]